MSDKAKAKKIDLRLTEKLYEEITLAGWVCEKKRSELLRMMIEFFIEHAKIRADGKNLAWHEILEVARDKQVAEEVTFEEICESMSRRQTGFEVSEELDSKLQVFAEIYAKNAIEAFKKHAGGRNDG